MVVEYSLKNIVQATFRGIMSAAVNQEDMVDNTHSCNTNPERSLHQQIV